MCGGCAGDRGFVCESMSWVLLMGSRESASGVRTIYPPASHNARTTEADGTTWPIMTAQGKRSAHDCRLKEVIHHDQRASGPPASRLAIRDLQGPSMLGCSGLVHQSTASDTHIPVCGGSGTWASRLPGLLMMSAMTGVLGQLFRGLSSSRAGWPLTAEDRRTASVDWCRDLRVRRYMAAHAQRPV